MLKAFASCILALSIVPTVATPQERVEIKPPEVERGRELERDPVRERELQEIRRRNEIERERAERWASAEREFQAAVDRQRSAVEQRARPLVNASTRKDWMFVSVESKKDRDRLRREADLQAAGPPPPWQAGVRMRGVNKNGNGISLNIPGKKKPFWAEHFLISLPPAEAGRETGALELANPAELVAAAPNVKHLLVAGLAPDESIPGLPSDCSFVRFAPAVFEGQPADVDAILKALDELKASMGRPGESLGSTGPPYVIATTGGMDLSTSPSLIWDLLPGAV